MALLLLLLGGAYVVHWLHLPENEDRRAKAKVEKMLKKTELSAFDLYQQALWADNDYLRRNLLRAAAERGFPQAQYALGICYTGDLATEANWKMAVKWMTKAAEQGGSEYQYGLGQYCMELARNGEKEMRERMLELAVRWYLKAAEQGNERAQADMGRLYYAGKGVEKNLKEAERWLLLAEEQCVDVDKDLARIYGEAGYPELSIERWKRELSQYDSDEEAPEEYKRELQEQERRLRAKPREKGSQKGEVSEKNESVLPSELYQEERNDDTECGRIKNEALQTSEVKKYMDEIQKKRLWAS